MDGYYAQEQIDKLEDKVKKNESFINFFKKEIGLLHEKVDGIDKRLKRIEQDARRHYRTTFGG